MCDNMHFYKLFQNKKLVAKQHWLYMNCDNLQYIIHHTDLIRHQIHYLHQILLLMDLPLCHKKKKQQDQIRLHLK